MPSGPVDPEGAARKAGITVYWVGDEYAGFPLSHASSQGRGSAAFIYGTCEARSDQGCGPPIQIQQFPFKASSWRIAARCKRLAPVRGVPAAHHDSLVLFTGTSVVKIYARNGAEIRRVARDLRPVEGRSSRSLPPPPAEIERLVDEVCGSG